MNKMALFIGDSLDALDYPRDTTVTLIKEFFHQKWNIFYLEFDHFKTVSSLSCSRLNKIFPNKNSPFSWDKDVSAIPSDFSIIFHRKDPPVDQRYKDVCAAFVGLDQKIVHVNNPELIASLPEKIVPLDFPDFCIPTEIINNPNDLKNLLKEHTGEIVVKPVNLFSGYGIEFFNAQTTSETIETYFKKFGPDIIVQEFVPEAEQLGDLRVMTFNGEFVGAFIRRAAPGNRLQNLHQGGSIHRYELSPKQQEGTKLISRELCKKGLYFLGIDFLGDKVSEINITSPMGLLQINELYDTHCETIVYEQCLKLIKEKSM